MTSLFFFLLCTMYTSHGTWDPVTMAWNILRLGKEKQPPTWRVAADILNKQSQTADKGWNSSLGVRCGVDNSSL